MSQIKQIARSALSQMAICFLDGLNVKAVMPSDPSTPIKLLIMLISITRNVCLSLLVYVIYNDVMACGIDDSGVFTVEYVSLNVSLETEYEPKLSVNKKHTSVEERLLIQSVASSVNLQPYFVINQLRLMCCSFLSILFFLAIMKIN